MKNQFLFKTLFVFAFTLFSISLNAQEKQNETYVITDKGSVANVQPYIDALNNSDMKYHRLKNKSYTIVFASTGVTVKLLSAAECIANGRKINLNDYPESFDSNRDEPIFSLGPNNFIMEQHSVSSKHK